MSAGVGIDAVDALQVLEDMRRSEQRFRSLVEDLHVGVVVQGPASEIIIANPRALELLGVDEAELERRTSYHEAWDIVREDGTPFAAAERPVAVALRTRLPVRNVVMGVWRPTHGDRVWLLVNATPELGLDGDVVKVVATLDDLTERKRLEASLATAERFESIGRLAGGVAHDFNNLLTVISSCAALALRRLPADVPGRGEVAAIVEAADRAAGLTGQLLAIARRQVLSPRVVALDELLHGLHALLARLVGPAVAIEIDAARGLWPVQVDPTQFERVVTNLAVNARDAMPRGGRLVIRAVAHTVLGPESGADAVAPGDYVRLTITDTGHGMDEHVLAHAFEPFFTTKPAGQGTGLGLATVHGIVKQSRGYIWITSAVGVGTTFTVLVPRAPAAP